MSVQVYCVRLEAAMRFLLMKAVGAIVTPGGVVVCSGPMPIHAGELTK